MHWMTTVKERKRFPAIVEPNRQSTLSKREFLQQITPPQTVQPQK